MKYLILLLICGSAWGNSISVGVLTHHNDVMSCGIKCNEQNNLLAIEYKNSIIATFNNSYYHQTYLMARKIEINKNLSILGGISYGYDQDCLNPFKTTCEDDGYYDEQISPFVSLLIQKKINNFKLSWLEGITYRSVLIGYSF